MRYRIAMMALTTPSTAANAKWYFLRYYPPPGQQFTALSGQIVVPTLPSAGGYYLWPGLQTDSSGVYQNVLDGRSGTWWFSSEWYTSSPSFWGSGFNAYPGETVSFSNNLNPSGSGWTTQILHETTGAAIASIFALSNKFFNQAVFAIELESKEWDFGPLIFKNVNITTTGTSTDWCTQPPENFQNATIYSVSGVSAVINSDSVTCSIKSLILERPA